MQIEEAIARIDSITQAMADMAIESWRFAKIFGRISNKLEPENVSRCANQLRYFLKKLEENLKVANLNLVNVESQPYDPGIAATALNLSDFGADDRLIVDQMLEPIIMGSNGLVRLGTVMLRKVDR